ncbi:glyoxylate/hydroxypyruvate reductase A [Falsirhodobacter sp. alg1]|uniref:2-hydroxyacid dehydrogenase n=1 Tax=Falsirhodobacter sp. alg1 TaxID=1472418 RepID=UPI0005EE4AF1|nr:glyoxylate/hydroxypyruvate reductase A [Falsirhodobacter sp. alg1]
MTVVFFAAGPRAWEQYRDCLPEALAAAGVDARIVTEVEAADRAAVDYIVFAPGGVIEDFGRYPNAKAVLNLWAGVERLVGNDTLTQPLCRMVDPSLTEGMVEWATGHVLRHHLGMDRYITADAPHWDQAFAPLARERRVTILGTGALGAACGQALARLNFPVTGWSRTAKQIEGLTCVTSLEQALDGAEIVVALLPDTPDTTNLLDAPALARLASGAVVINPGRGPLIDDEALLDALDSGRISHATLDVFRTEPLPPEHAFWAHPRITVTPHVAAATRPRTASVQVAENIRRGEAGLPFINLVDRTRGY